MCIRDSSYNARAWLMVALVSIWGLRLSAYLLWRNWGHDEDRRYRAMRDRRDESFWWTSLFIVFWLQAGLMWLISFPIQFVVATSTSELWWLDYVGFVCFSVGLFFESVSDFQLAKFLAEPNSRGKVLDRGLWGLTRHPNSVSYTHLTLPTICSV